MFDVLKNTVVPAIVSRIPPALLLRLAGITPVVAYYHIVSDEDVPHVKHLYKFRTPAEFRRDLDAFLRLYHPITLDELLTSLRTGDPLPAGAFLLTFDDGFRQMYDVVAPILVEKSVSATFFIATQFMDNVAMAHHNKISVLISHIEKMGNDVPCNQILELLADGGVPGNDITKALLAVPYDKRHLVDEVARLMRCDFGAYLAKAKPYLGSEQIGKLIAMGFSIGGHSVDHPMYSELPLEQQLAQTLGSVRTLRRQFGLNYGAFAFPHGATHVSKRFFTELSATGEVDVSFGTAGMLKDMCPRHFERFSCEYDPAPAERIIARNYARSLFKALIGEQTVRRS